MNELEQIMYDALKDIKIMLKYSGRENNTKRLETLDKIQLIAVITLDAIDSRLNRMAKDHE